MRRRQVTAFLLATALALAGVPAAPVVGAPAPARKERPAASARPETTELVIAYADGSRAAVDREVGAGGGRVTKRSRRGDRAVVVAADAPSARSLRARLSRMPGVRYVEPVVEFTIQRTPTDPEYSRQWGLPRIGAPAAWDTTTGASDVVIAVVDTGVDIQHPDLAGRVDTVNDWDFANADSDADDDEGHGTHVAGIAAAVMDNGIEGCGVAPGVTLLPVKVLDKHGSGDTLDVADGIEWAADKGADIISMSLGARYYSQAIADAVAYAQSQGSLVVAAAGNDASSVSYPAKLPGVVTVSAVGLTDQLATFSNRGVEVDLGAPGVDIYSILCPDVHGDRPGEEWDGTSMATPFVSGAAALVLSEWPQLTADEVAMILYTSAEDLGAPGRDTSFGYGMLRVDTALAEPPPADDIYEPDDSAAQATTATVGDWYLHTSDPLGDQDWHRFVAEADRTYRIRTGTLQGGADTYLRLYGTDGVTEIAESDDATAGQLWSEIEWVAPAGGTYYFRNADEWGAGGSYRVTVTDVTPAVLDTWEPDDTAFYANRIPLTAETTHTSSPIGESDYMYFDAVAGHTYHVRTSSLSPSADTSLYLYDQLLMPVAWNDDRDFYGGDLSSEIYWSATTTGRVYIENVDEWECGGSYSLTADDITPPRDTWEPDDSAALAKPVQFAVPATHSASPAGEDDWTYFTVESGHLYRVVADQLTDNADTSLYLYRSATSSYLVRNDDVDYEGGDYSSALDWRANYSGRVYAVNKDEWHAGGGYTLTVTDLSSPTVPVQEYSGAERYATAAMVSASAFPTGSPVVLLATGADYPDALAAGSLAGAWDAPVLLVPPAGTLPPAVATEIDRLGATRAIVLGGTGAVDAGMAAQVKALLGAPATLERIPGSDRYATARLVAQAARAKMVAESRTPPDSGFAVTGRAFADAMAVSPLSFATGEPIVLVPPAVDAATSAFVTSMGLHELTIVGGTGAVSAEASAALAGIPGVTSVGRISAADRYQTCAAFAEYAGTRGLDWSVPALATGATFPDALTAGPMQGRSGSMVLLTSPLTLSPSAGAALTAHKAEVTGLRFLGGSGAIASSTRLRVYEALR